MQCGDCARSDLIQGPFRGAEARSRVVPFLPPNLRWGRPLACGLGNEVGCCPGGITGFLAMEATLGRRGAGVGFAGTTRDPDGPSMSSSAIAVCVVVVVVGAVIRSCRWRGQLPERGAWLRCCALTIHTLGYAGNTRCRRPDLTEISCRHHYQCSQRSIPRIFTTSRPDRTCFTRRYKIISLTHSRSHSKARTGAAHHRPSPSSRVVHAVPTTGAPSTPPFWNRGFYATDVFSILINARGPQIHQTQKEKKKEKKKGRWEGGGAERRGWCWSRLQQPACIAIGRYGPGGTAAVPFPSSTPRSFLRT